MVDVGSKKDTERQATASATVHLPLAAYRAVAVGQATNDLLTKKGPVFATAIVAGTMAAKNTSQLIPFCHPLPLTHCNIEITKDQSGEGNQEGGGSAASGGDFPISFTVTCSVKTFYRTGVEMEALTGASVAALTMYDMLKGVPNAQPGLRITDVQLNRKSGGKKDFTRSSSVNAPVNAQD